MTPTQRSAALRLADWISTAFGRRIDCDEIAALLRELVTEPQCEPAVTHHRCNYLVACGKVCNKCGRTHCDPPQQSKPQQNDEHYCGNCGSTKLACGELFASGREWTCRQCGNVFQRDERAITGEPT